MEPHQDAVVRSSLLLLFVPLILLAGCSETEQSSSGGRPEARTIKVVTQPVKLEPFVDEVQALGTARANESIEIRPRLASLVTKIGFEEGQTVESGDLLVELENSEIRAGLELAQASLAESRSLYERSRSLASTQAISQSNLEELLAQVKVDEAQVQAARARLQNTRILAPFSGRVGLRNVSLGSFVDSSTVITTLDDTETIKLDFSVPETFLNVVETGLDIDARSAVYPDRKFTGVIRNIDTRVDPVSRTVLVRATIDNNDASLKPGMFMTVDLQRPVGDKLLAPEQSIVPEGNRQFVYVVTEGVVEKREVSLGRRVPGMVVVEEGLVSGDLLITEGTQRVNDGSVVETIDQTSLSQISPRMF